MDPNIWGPYTWYYVHLVTYSMPDDPLEFAKKKKYYIQFFSLLGYLLPCNKCRYHYNNAIKKPMIIEKCATKNATIDWMIDYHNYVDEHFAEMPFYGPVTRQEADLLYMFDNKPYINHQKLNVFPNIVLNNVMYAQKCKQFLDIISHIHPCILCRSSLFLEIHIKNSYKFTKILHFTNISKPIRNITCDH